MPPDPQRVVETRAWFSEAARDLRAADLELGASPPLLDHVVCNAQQAAEKTMKGLLTWESGRAEGAYALRGGSGPGDGAGAKLHETVLAQLPAEVRS